jgi:hypothetical protein
MAYRRILSYLGVAILVLGLAICGQVSAQVISGDLVGTVLDKTGAAVPKPELNIRPWRTTRVNTASTTCRWERITYRQ